MRRTASLRAVLVMVALSTTAFAADPEASEKARAAFEHARDAYAKKSYAAAAAAFEESAGHVTHPAPLANAADAWERAGDYVRAARACDRVLAMSGVEPAVRSVVEATLARVLAHVATFELEGPSGATVRVDDGAPTPLPLRVRVAPGPHDVASGASHLRIVGDPGVVTRRVVDEAPRTAPVAVASPTPSRSAMPPPGTFVAYGVGLVATAAGVYFGAATLDHRADWRDTGSLDARSDFYRDRGLANVAFGTALVAAVVGTVLWLRDERPAVTSAARSGRR